MRTFILPAALLLWAISTVAVAGGGAEIVVDAARAQRQISGFKDSLKRVGIRGRLECSQVIELIQDSPDYSFGAFCDLAVEGASRKIMLCDDSMIGKFTVRFWGFAVDLETLEAFTRANCPGGG